MLTERYAKPIRGVLSCFDRLVIQGTLPDIAHAQAFTRELNRQGIRIFDSTKFEDAATSSGSRVLYYLTRLGRRLIAAALRLREDSIIPSLADAPA